ncbi:MAG TPA: hypothetical protein ENK45_00580 [Aliiroseovarius sp.]|nr:hypothetical protein [Aliiroseovarius sp.]
MAFQLPLFSGGLPALSAQPPGRKPPEVTRVTKGSESARANADSGNLAKGADNADIAANARKHHALGRRSGEATPPPTPPAGPPPAFKVSILEQQLDLDLALARSQAARGRSNQQILAHGPPQPDPRAGQAGAAPGAGAQHAKDKRPT